GPKSTSIEPPTKDFDAEFGRGICRKLQSNSFSPSEGRSAQVRPGVPFVFLAPRATRPSQNHLASGLRVTSSCGGLRIWWNWQTRYFEVVVPQGVQVQVLLSAPSFLRKPRIRMDP